MMERFFMKKNWPSTSHRLFSPKGILRAAILFIFIAILFTGYGCSDPPPEQEGGTEIQTPDLPNNQRVSSPITIVPPLLRCGESVTVKGFVSGVRLRIYVNNVERGSDTGRDPEGQT